MEDTTTRLDCVWARHEAAGDRWSHAIAAIEARGSVLTYCSGRWPATDPVEIGAPREQDRCERCWLLVRLSQRHPRVIASGLRPVAERFDTSDSVELKPEDFDEEADTLGGEG